MAKRADVEVPRDERGRKEVYRRLDTRSKRPVVGCTGTCGPGVPAYSKPPALRKVPRPDKQLQCRNFEDIEYSMDFFDLRLLRSFRTLRISKRIFELLVDRMEKEWFACIKRMLADRKRRDTAERRLQCDICAEEEQQEDNSLLACIGCRLPVHQKCYGVPNIRENWVCRKCLCLGSAVPKCEFCPNTGGAYKQTRNGRWGHVLCVLYSAELSFSNLVFMEPIDRRCDGHRCRVQEPCVLCQESSGIVLECGFAECKRCYHTTCGIDSGFYFDHANFVSYCDEHSPTNKTLFWSMEDFYGFDTLSYRKLSCIPRIRKSLPPHKPEVSQVLEIRHMDPVLTAEMYWRILDVDLSELEAEYASRVLELVGAFWMIKRRHTGAPLLPDLDVLSADTEILSWTNSREERRRSTGAG